MTCLEGCLPRTLTERTDSRLQWQRVKELLQQRDDRARRVVQPAGLAQGQWSWPRSCTSAKLAFVIEHRTRTLVKTNACKGGLRPENKAETLKNPLRGLPDLMPLVQDGVASPESEALVQAHMAVCPACRALWLGTDDRHAGTARPDDGKILQNLRRRYSTHLLLLAFVGIAAGVALGVYRQRQLGYPVPAVRLGRSDLPGYRHGG